MTQKQPISTVEWVDPATLSSNDYNPNRVFGPEMELLAKSIMESGWTQPIVASRDGQIVDGFHRWTLGTNHAGIRKLTDGLVPVVRVDLTREQAIAATVRHNRARGQHGVLRMAAIVRELRASGLDDEEIQRELGMESEEVDRLGDVREQPEIVGRDTYGRGWVPEKQK
tara:strand:+ start:408 stop:914 length:507 start_codon:yes stop_codon:yes gene_type:complete